jgi:uncharacterized RDD family membrane protein YckC
MLYILALMGVLAYAALRFILTRLLGVIFTQAGIYLFIASNSKELAAIMLIGGVLTAIYQNKERLG